MAELKDKIQNVLDESRMLILGAQVLLGFEYRSAFESGFEKLPRHTQYLKLGGLGLMLAAVALLILPGAYHRIVSAGEDTEELHRFSSKVMELALLPFAFTLGIDFYVAGEKLNGNLFGAIAGAVACVVALFYWYGLGALHKAERVQGEQTMKARQQAEQGTELKDKIKHVLTEARTVLPGAQALLGFQLTTMFMEAFERLPAFSKYAHLASLTLVALSIIFLMTPAAYHRIVERGEETEHFHRFSSRMILAALLPLALGICGDFFVVLDKVMGSHAVALTAAALMLAVFYGLWFGLTLFSRRRRAVR
jgi:magnesium-transporting ATPase (P-type)